MVIKEVELLFQAGALDVPIIKPHESEEGWSVTLNGKHKLNPTLETARPNASVKTTGRSVGGFCLNWNLGR